MAFLNIIIPDSKIKTVVKYTTVDTELYKKFTREAKNEAFSRN